MWLWRVGYNWVTFTSLPWVALPGLIITLCSPSLLLFSLFLSPMPDNELIESRMFCPICIFFLFIPLLFHFLTGLTHGRYLIDICWKICICCHDQKNKSTSYLFFVFHVLYVGETFDWLAGRRWLCLLYFNYNSLENRYNINGVVSLLQMGTYQCLHPIKLYKLLSYHIIWQARAAHSLTIGIVWIVFFVGLQHLYYKIIGDKWPFISESLKCVSHCEMCSWRSVSFYLCVIVKQVSSMCLPFKTQFSAKCKCFFSRDICISIL